MNSLKKRTKNTQNRTQKPCLEKGAGGNRKHTHQDSLELFQWETKKLQYRYLSANQSDINHTHGWPHNRTGKATKFSVVCKTLMKNKCNKKQHHPNTEQSWTRLRWTNCWNYWTNKINRKGTNTISKTMFSRLIHSINTHLGKNNHNGTVICPNFASSHQFDNFNEMHQKKTQNDLKNSARPIKIDSKKIKTPTTKSWKARYRMHQFLQN